jgi:hypothetical protein
MVYAVLVGVATRAVGVPVAFKRSFLHAALLSQSPFKSEKSPFKSENMPRCQRTLIARMCVLQRTATTGRVAVVDMAVPALLWCASPLSQPVVCVAIATVPAPGKKDR